MSRTYNKRLKMNRVCGSNTEWYRDRNRLMRIRNRQELHKVKLLILEDMDDSLEFLKLPHDDWEEPTAGNWVMTKRDFNRYKCQKRNGVEDDAQLNWLIKKASRKLKPYDKSKRAV